MRDIIFRGKTKEGEWVHGSLVVTTHGLEHKPSTHTKTWIVWSSFGNGGWFNVKGRSYVLPETVGQWTGLLDCEGNKIFEGDIITDCYKRIMKVVFIKGRLMLEAVKETNFKYSDVYEWVEIDSLMETKVIGNIYENPELLEV